MKLTDAANEMEHVKLLLHNLHTHAASKNVQLEVLEQLNEIIDQVEALHKKLKHLI